MANRGWIKLVDKDFNQLESLRRGETLRCAVDPEIGLPVAYVVREGKVRMLDMWTDALHLGLVSLQDVMSCGIGIEYKSFSVLWPETLH